MAVEIRRGSHRFVDKGPGRATSHGFSFGRHYDPKHTSFGPMVVHDDHRLAEGQGFAAHDHADLVIVSWVIAGEVRHRDDSGSTAVLEPGVVGILRAGAGITHSEVAAAPQTRFVQVWLTAERAGGPGSYEVVPVGLQKGMLTEVAAPQPGAKFSVAWLGAGDTVTLPAAPRLHVFVGRGALTRFSLAEPLADGDAMLLTDEPAHEVTAAVPSELLVWSFS